MKVVEVPFDLTDYLSAKFGHPDRTEGLHVSRIYGDLDRMLNAKRYATPMPESQLNAFAQIGFLWERVLETALATLTVDSDPARYFRPGEQTLDGVLATPDYADLDFFGDGTCELGLEEWKANWSSSDKGDDLEKNFWRWLVQMKAYCWILGTRYARLRVVFMVGNWRDSIAPKTRAWEFEFGHKELQDNWTMLMTHAKAKGWTTNASTDVR